MQKNTNRTVVYFFQKKKTIQRTRKSEYGKNVHGIPKQWALSSLNTECVAVQCTSGSTMNKNSNSETVIYATIVRFVCINKHIHTWNLHHKMVQNPYFFVCANISLDVFHQCETIAKN